MAGVELNNNTALKAKENTKTTKPAKKMAKAVAGVGLNNNTVLLNFREIYENEEQVTEKIGETVAGVQLNNNTESTKQSER